MPSSLNMADQLLQLAQQAAGEARNADAVRTLTQLLGMRELPDPIKEKGYGLLGQLHLEEGNYSRARRHLRIALAFDDGCASHHFHLGRALDWDEQDGDDEEALVHYREAVRLDSDNVAYRSAMGLLMTYTDRVTEGLPHLEAAVRGAPDDMEFRYNLCVGLVNGGDMNRALAEIRRALARHPGDAAFQHLQAELDRLQAERASPPSSERPEEPVVTSIAGRIQERNHYRQQEAKRLSTRTGLRSALTQVPSHWLTAMAGALDVPADGSADQRRMRIYECLLTPGAIDTLLARLSAEARQVLATVLGGGGWIDTDQLRRQYPTDANDRWWWHDAPPRSAIGSLRLHGLLFIGTGRVAGESRRVAVVPNELRKPLSDGLDVR